MKKFVLPILLLFALGMRLPGLGGSFWMDEAAQALESRRPFADQYKIPDDFQPPLLHYIVHFMLGLSDGEAWLRLVSMSTGLVSIALLYIILKKHAGEGVAIGGALLLAASPFHIFFSQELRQYSLACFFACLSWYALLERCRQKKRSQTYLFIFATVGGLYSMYLYPFLMLAQFLYVFFEQKQMRKTFVLMCIVSSVFFLPWLPFFVEQLRVGTGLTHSLPGWASAVATPQIKAPPLTFAKFIVGQVELKDSFVYVLVSTFVLILAGAAIWRNWENKKTRFLVYWLLIPVITAWLVSFIVPVIQPKRVMIVLPAFAGILGSWISKKKLVFLLIFYVFIAFAWLQITTPKYQRENWRGLIHTIELTGKGYLSAAVFAFPESFAPWRWYAEGSVAQVTTRSLRVETVDQLKVPFAELNKYQRIFVFDYLRDLSDPNHTLESWLTASGYHAIGLIDGGNVGFVRVYGSL